MKRAASVGVGLIAGVVSWYAVLFGVDAAVAHISRLMGMTGGGDVAGPLIAMFAGAFYALAIILIVTSATINGSVAQLVLACGAVPAVVAEWMLASYIVDKKRFISPEYDSLSGPRPIQLTDDTTILWHIAAVTAAHVLLFVVATAVVFLITRAIAKRGRSLETSRSKPR